MVRRVLRCSSAPSRCFYSDYASQSQALKSRMERLAQCSFPTVVSIASFFYRSDERIVPHSCRGGNCFFLHPNLIVTSAHVVGRVSAACEKPDGFDHGSVRYESYIGSTIAMTCFAVPLKTRPLAVNFTKDIAVLEVSNWSSPHCILANSPPDEDNHMINISQTLDLMTTIINLEKVSALKAITVRAKAPWPLDEETGWIEHEMVEFLDDPASNSSTLLNSREEKLTGSIKRRTGSPLLNLDDGEVVGISSWEVRDEPNFLVGFAVPALSIHSVLDYAKKKGPEDPVVMDQWISSHVIPKDNS